MSFIIFNHKALLIVFFYPILELIANYSSVLIVKAIALIWRKISFDKINSTFAVSLFTVNVNFQFGKHFLS